MNSAVDWTSSSSTLSSDYCILSLSYIRLEKYGDRNGTMKGYSTLHVDLEMSSRLQLKLYLVNKVRERQMIQGVLTRQLDASRSSISNSG